MKKIILTISALTLFSTVVEARDISSGTIMVTGDSNIEFGSSKTSYQNASEKTDTTSINLAGLYFPANNLGVGLMVGSDDSKTDDGTTVTKEKITMVGPIAGYNISVNSDASIMFAASLFTATGDIDNGAGLNADIDGDGYLLMGMFNYYLNEHVAVNVGLRRVKADIDFSSGGTTVKADMTETATTIGLATFF